jgi:putative FmdB family regulatory protein
MPLYEYSCEECGTVFEELVSLGTKETPPCPDCSSEKTVKMVSLVASLGGGGSGCSAKPGFS